MPLILFAISLLFMKYMPFYFPFYPNIFLAIFCLSSSCIFAFYSLRAFKQNKCASLNPFHPEKTQALLTTGIYRISRNPMYFSLLLALLAYFFCLGNLFTLCVIVTFVYLLTEYQIKREEKVLLTLFPKQYKKYQEEVHRWI